MKNILITLTLLLLSLNLMAQTPDKISYQAVVRNGNNTLVTNQQIGLKVSVLQGSVTGTSVYAETHTPTTNANGLLTVAIGSGTMLADSFNKINWANGPYFIKTEIDPNGGNSYSITGTTQLLSVPYALHARTADSIVGAKSFSGNYNDLTNKPITISNIVGDTFKLSNGGYILSAKSVNTPSQPTIITNPVTNITSNGARFTASKSNDSLQTIYDSGIIISTDPNPGLMNNYNGRHIYLYSCLDSTLTVGLTSNTKYYVRAYSRNENNTFLYGNQVIFTTLSVGQQGLAGGIVFYDKGDTIGGWRYLEAAQTDQSTGIKWGCGDSLSPLLITGTETNLGKGQANTQAIVSKCNNTINAAKLCNDLIIGNYSDWFLPSVEELWCLILNFPNSFQVQTSYWSSSESDHYNAFGVWKNDNQGRVSGPTLYKFLNQKVRAIRKF
jgi:hypothetical protein